MTYIKWTEGFEFNAKFLLMTYKNYDYVAEQLSISRSALKNRNNKYWNIDCRAKWSEYNILMLDKFFQEGKSKKEISFIFSISEQTVTRLKNLYNLNRS